MSMLSRQIEQLPRMGDGDLDDVELRWVLGK